MTSSVPNENLVNALLDTLVTVAKTPFNNDAAMTAVRDLLGLNQNSYRDGVTSAIYGELDPGTTNTSIRYKTLTIAYGVSKTANSGYDYGNEFIKTGTNPSLEDKLAAEARRIAVPLYRNYLEQGLQTQAPTIQGQKIQFLPLFGDVGFCTAFARHVLDTAFINDQLIAIYGGGNKAYAQSIAYLYERMRPTLVQAPTMDRKTGTSNLIQGNSPQQVSSKSAAAHWQPVAQENPTFKDKPDALSEFLQMSLPLEWSNDDLLQPPSFPSIGDAFNNEFIKSGDIRDLAQSVTGATKENFQQSQFPGSGGELPPPLIITTYGGDLVDWINSQADHGYGDVFNHGSAHQDFKVPSIIPSCFVPGTIVRTDSGDHPIENLKQGTRVLAKLPSLYGVLSDERVMVPTSRGDSLASRAWVYGFNQEEPFFTGGHIFFTKAGPKAIFPEYARQENPGIQVHQLVVGDVLFQLSTDSGTTKYIEVPVTKFSSKLATCDYVHGLHFRKGDKGGCTYHANGYLVAANYPDITLKRLEDNFTQLSPKEQSKFAALIPELPASLRSVFGPTLVDAFETSFAQPYSQLATYVETQKLHLKEKTKKRHLHPALLVRSFSLIHWKNLRNSRRTIHSSSPNFKSHVAVVNDQHALPELSVSHGALLIDGHLVPHARIDPTEIHWSRPLQGHDSDVWEHGMVKTSSDGTFVHGAIGQGPSPSVAAQASMQEKLELQNTTHVFGVSHANDYNMLMSSKGPSSSGTFSTAAQADSASYPGSLTWTSFHKIEIGLSTTDKGVVQVTVTLPDLDKNWNDAQDPLYTAVSGVDQTTFTLVSTVTVVAGMEEFLNDLCQPGTWKPVSSNDQSVPPAFFTIKLKVNLATNIVTGDYTELVPNPDPATQWSAGPYHALYCPYSPKVLGLRSQALQAIASSSNQLEESVPLALGTNFHNLSANIHHDPAPLTANLAKFIATSNDDLPVAYLQTMTTPADVDLHASSQNYMIAAAGYWRGDDEIKVFGDEKDAIAKSLPDSLKDGLSSDSRTFIRDNFSKNLLIYSLSRNSNYQDKFDDNRKDKLQFWWTGKTDKCLSHMKPYNDVTTITAGLAFMDLADDGFKPYVNSNTDYAKTLYDAITDDAILNNLAVSVILGNQNLVNRYCAILNALDRQHRTYDNQLWALVRDKQFMQMAAGSPEFAEDWSEFAQAYMKDLQEKIRTGDASISDDMRKEMQFDLDQLKAGLDAKDEADLAFKIFDRTSELGGNILAVIDQFKRRAARAGQANAPAFLTALEERLANSPKLKAVFASVKGVVMIGMQAYTLYSSISFLLNWNNLTPDQRAVAVLTAVEAVLRAIYELGQTYKELRGLSPDSLDFRIRCVRWSNASAKKVKMEDESGVEKPVINEEKVAEVPRVMDADGNLDPNVPEKSVAQQVAENGTTTGAEAATTMSKTFSLSSFVVEGVMVAVNIATAVMLGIELKDEWDNVSDSIRALDTINLIVQCAQVVTGVVALGVMVVGAELSCLPIVGVLVAVAGLVMMLVEQFYPRPKPDPIQDYLNDHGYGYVDALDHSPNPQLKYSVTHTQETSGKLAIDIEISQPAGLSPDPMINQLMVKIYAGTTDTDVFLPPTSDVDHNVTANDIVWSIIDDNGTFKIQGNNNPDPNDHSLLGRVYPTTAATTSNDNPPKTDPGTSVLGSATLKVRIEGTPNPALKSMAGQVTEILVNPPKGVAGTDVVASFTVDK